MFLYLERSHKPCCHILCKFLNSCKRKGQQHMRTLPSGPDPITQMRYRQADLEAHPSKRGYRYPNGSRYGHEFVNIWLGSRSEAQRHLRLADERKDAQDIVSQILSSLRWIGEAQSLRCKSTRRLLAHMNDDSFRRRILHDKWPGNSLQGATPLRTAASRGLIKYISQYPEDDFPVLS